MKKTRQNSPPKISNSTPIDTNDSEVNEVPEKE
jgi:hypothetical protein